MTRVRRVHRCVAGANPWYDARRGVATDRL